MVQGDSSVNHPTLWKTLAVVAFFINFIPNLIPGSTVLKGPIGYNTPFTINHVFFVIFWAFLYLLQIAYLVQLFRADSQSIAVKQTPTFVLFVLLECAWSALWVKHYWWFAEVAVALNLLQIIWAYFQYQTFKNKLSSYLTVHAAVVALPFAYLFHILAWNGAVATHAHNLAARLFANIFIWMFFFVPVWFLFAYRDWMLGFAFSFLTAGLAVGQFLTKIIAFQWIFAFSIMAAVFVLSVGIAVSAFVAGKPAGHAGPISEDTERAPLLQD